MSDWKPMELHPVDPAFTAMAEDSAREFQAELAMKHAYLVEVGLRTLLVYVPSSDIELCSFADDAHRVLVLARGTPMYEVTTDLFGEVVTVSGEWLAWPPPEYDCASEEVRTLIAKKRR